MNNYLIIFGVFIILLAQSIFAQNPPNERLRRNPLCNGIATYLPKPEYPKIMIDGDALDWSGVVNVQVLIDEQGNVASAKAVTGHPLLHSQAENVVLKAKFTPQKLSGEPIKFSCVIVYKFVPEGRTQIPKTQEKYISGGIINGKATKLPKPTFPQEAKDFCASGQVKIEVLIGEDGNVISAKAISGDELLLDSSVEAAKKAKFAPINDIRVKVKGIVVYNFVPEKKCIFVGIVNKKALNIPIFSIHPHIKIKQNTIVEVRVVIDMSGEVIRAKASETVPPSLRGMFETAARSAKFSPILINSPPILVSGIIAYRLKIDGTVESDIFDKKKN